MSSYTMNHRYMYGRYKHWQKQLGSSNIAMPNSPYEMHLQGIMVVLFNVAKSSICLVEYSSHDFLQVHLIEGIGHS